MAHKPTHQPSGQDDSFLDAFLEAIAGSASSFAETLADAIAEAVRVELALFRAELAELLEDLGQPGTAPPVIPPAVPPIVPPVAPPVDPEPVEPTEPVEPEEPDPVEPEEPPVVPADAVRREGTVSYDEFVGVPGVAEVFVVLGADEVRGFVSGEDFVELPADAIGRSGAPLTDFETATGEEDLREGSFFDADSDAGTPVALLFTDGDVALIEGAAPLNERDWLFV